jgi:hypothetical protein
MGTGAATPGADASVFAGDRYHVRWCCLRLHQYTAIVYRFSREGTIEPSQSQHAHRIASLRQRCMGEKLDDQAVEDQ